MRRLFYQTKLYDYNSRKEAEKDIEKMKEKGYFPKEQNNGSYIYENGQDGFPYSVEYQKGI